MKPDWEWLMTGGNRGRSRVGQGMCSAGSGFRSIQLSRWMQWAIFSHPSGVMGLARHIIYGCHHGADLDCVLAASSSTLFGLYRQQKAGDRAQSEHAPPSYTFALSCKAFQHRFVLRHGFQWDDLAVGGSVRGTGRRNRHTADGGRNARGASPVPFSHAAHTSLRPSRTHLGQRLVRAVRICRLVWPHLQVLVFTAFCPSRDVHLRRQLDLVQRQRFSSRWYLLHRGHRSIYRGAQGPETYPDAQHPPEERWHAPQFLCDSICLCANRVFPFCGRLPFRIGLQRRKTNLGHAAEECCARRDGRWSSRRVCARVRSS